MADQNVKKYPPATPEIAKLMGLSGIEEAPVPTPVAAPAANLPVVELPVVDTPHPVNVEQPKDRATGVPKVLHKLETEMEDPSHLKSEEPVKAWPVLQMAKVVFPFVLVFVVGVILYFFFFSKIDLGNLFQSSSPAQSVQNTALLNLEKQNQSAYNTWIKSFYYDVSDPAVLDMNTDNSGNGLTNFQKYLLNLNPKSYDTMGLGMADSEALAQGINPLSGAPLTEAQKQVLDKYFDMETIMNKLALEKLNGSTKGLVGGAQILGAATTTASSDPPTVLTANDPVNASLDINQKIPGRLQIPSLKVEAPLIFSQSTNDFDKDLLNGVIHYPGTALPGQVGTSYISGHSSNYPWVKSNYNHIFTQLGNLGVNESFTITVTLTNGKQATLHYVVTKSQEYSPTDQAQFANAGTSVVALSTCWPVNTTQKRLVVFGQLTQVEQ